MTARAALRAATGAAHERVDALFSRFPLGDEAGYRDFLLAQAGGFLPVENALDAAGAERVLPDWPNRRRGDLLRVDLAALNVTAPEPFSAPPLFSGKAPMLGAIYVLEGSRLGGAVLKRTVPSHFPRRFLEARQAAGSWRSFLQALDDLLIRPDDLAAACQAAREVFARFEQAADAQLEA
ncbi:MAG TPA: biliverdin-producing heme oxygenase [Allosphingosinicella sp.]|nr:biliverdin-producing heme oxygenase [Allosphingosinicella sp.]